MSPARTASTGISRQQEGHTVRRARTAYISAALIVAACSCGSDSDQAADESTTTEQPADPADLAIAESALLTLSDFPSGWSEVPSVDEEFSDEMNDARLEFAGCFGSESFSVLDFSTAKAETGDFTSPDENTISNTVAIGDQAAAEAFMDRYGGDGVSACLTDAAAKIIEVGFSEADDAPDDAAIGTVTVGRLNLTPVGDELVAYRVTVPISVSGFEVEFYIDQIGVRVGRGITGVNVESSVFPMDASDIDGYVATAAERLAAAL